MRKTIIFLGASCGKLIGKTSAFPHDKFRPAGGCGFTPDLYKFCTHLLHKYFTPAPAVVTGVVSFFSTLSTGPITKETIYIKKGLSWNCR